jgi:hypothetical protein
VPCGRTDRHDEASSHFSQFYECASKAINFQIHARGTNIISRINSGVTLILKLVVHRQTRMLEMVTVSCRIKSFGILCHIEWCESGRLFEGSSCLHPSK